MIPSGRVYLLLILGIAIALFLSSVYSVSTGILGTLLFDVIVLGLTIVDAVSTWTRRVEITRHPLGRLSIGRDNPIALSVKTGKRPAKLIIRDYYPIEFGVSTPLLQISLPRNSSQELTYTVHPTHRGEYSWGDIQVRQLGVLGLAWDDWKIPQSTKVAVYPDLIGLRQLSIRLTLQNTGTMRQARRMGIGTEFAELREYRMGDDPRFVDWKATARRLGATPAASLQVRVLEPEQEQTLIILLDRGRLMTARVQGLKRFDWGLNATLSLALAGLNRGDKVGVGVFDREVTTWIPPERGQHQLSKLVDRLTPIQPVLLEPDYVGAVTKLVNRQTRRALVVLITDIVDTTASAELLGALGRLTPRYLPFCVTLRDPQVDKLAHTSSANVEGAYSRAVALDLLSQRQVAFAQLKQKGVLVLDAPADKISDRLVDRYLQLKARNQL
ncbi:DUF58 domain-containing protein [Planktothrix sp. FACHB-1355]|uniref:DUF58 domain-containing protein n=1 Tax=Aerosakkonema funiforme FACHB-1375 TaxID=2949571 RepID=A0A926VCK3_9CYAN|nr:MULTISPECIES: DUF58 domain-containing protein [Oscillatoriales]MBD2181366.1 DUF58 domain-containing protein [Aerosakkonema funiforme FACHB-1375]MBD3557740.1 DUF58 domain-containing protein [Planktothrix sp. FACHB-1355]